MPPARLYVLFLLLSGATPSCAAPLTPAVERVPETALSTASSAAPGYRIGDLLVAPKKTGESKPRRVIRLLITKFA